jgi:transcriptional regulator with XRE-family HTH domain
MGSMVGTDATYTLTLAVPPVRTGWWLGNARRSFGVSENTVAQCLAVSSRTVRRWESGGAVPTDQQLAAMAAVFGCDVEALVPGARVGESVMSEVGGDCAGDNDVVLRRFVARVRTERCVGGAERVHLRHDDVEALAAVLDLADTELQRRLVAIVGITADEARWVGRQLFRRRLLAPVAGIGVMAAGCGNGGAAPIPTPVAAAVVTVADHPISDSEWSDRVLSDPALSDPVLSDPAANAVAAPRVSVPTSSAGSAAPKPLSTGGTPSTSDPSTTPPAPVIGDALVITPTVPGSPVLIDPLVIENPEFSGEGAW